MFLHLIEQRQLTDQFLVDSAGTGGWHVGNPADRRMQAAARRRGIHLPSRARQIELGDLESFDYILVMDQDNLRNVSSMANELGPRSTAKIRLMLSHARRADTLEVPDPYYGGADGFELMYRLLDSAVLGLIESIESILEPGSS